MPTLSSYVGLTNNAFQFDCQVVPPTSPPSQSHCHNHSRLPSSPEWITATAFSRGSPLLHLPHINLFSTWKPELSSLDLNKLASLCFVKPLHLKSKLITVAQEAPVTSSLCLIFFTHRDPVTPLFFVVLEISQALFPTLVTLDNVVFSPCNTLFPTLHKGSFSSFPPCYFFHKAFLITRTRGGIAHLSSLFISFLVPIKT